MKTQLNDLDLIQIASPCPASWDEMVGDERARFCGQCQLNVYNLSEMSRDEAERLVQQREGRMCVRFYRRQDGTVLTKDCPVGVRALRERFVRAVAAIAGVFVALLSGTLFGGVISRRLPSNMRTPSQAFADWIQPERRLVMGDIAMPNPPVMGKVCAPPALPVLQPPGSPLTEPAETPLAAPTPEQLEQIQERLER